MPRRIVAMNATEAWVSMLRNVLAEGTEVEVRGMKTIELLNTSLQIPVPTCNLIDHPLRKMPHRFSLAEMVWILTGQNRVSLIEPYNKGYGSYSDDRVHMMGAYGPMVAEQLPWVIEQLSGDQSTRQAVMTIWRPRPGFSKDIPCTLALQFMVRGNAVHLTSTMRSNDLIFGLPSDMYVFTSLLRYVTSSMGLSLGSWTHNVMSSHIYEEHWELAQSVADSPVDARGEGDTRTPLPIYPWPHAALAALSGASGWPDLPASGGWGEILNAMVGVTGSDTSFDQLIQRGRQPRGV